MAKPKKDQKHPPKKKSKEKAEKKKFVLPNIIKNFMILDGVLFLLNTLKEQVPGYKWVAETLVAKTPEQLVKYKDLTYDQKMEGKLGFAYKYFKFINETRLRMRFCCSHQTLLLDRKVRCITPNKG